MSSYILLQTSYALILKRLVLSCFTKRLVNYIIKRRREIFYFEYFISQVWYPVRVLSNINLIT